MLTIDDHDAIRAAAKALPTPAFTVEGDKIQSAVHGVVVEKHQLELARGYLRYEALRKLNAGQYARLSALHLALSAEPKVTFDELVDLLVIGELQL